MIKFLRKNKVKSFLSEKQTDFLLFQSLPIKESKFLDLKKILYKENMKIKFLKAKEAGGILKSISTPEYESVYKKIFYGTILMVQSIDPIKSSLIKNYAGLLKSNEHILKEMRLSLIAFCKEGSFYHSLSLSKFLTNFDEKTIVKNLALSIINPSVNILKPLSFSTTKLVFILKELLNCQKG